MTGRPIVPGIKHDVAVMTRDTGTRPEKIRIQKWYTVYKDHITLSDYEISDGFGKLLLAHTYLRGLRK